MTDSTTAVVAAHAARHIDRFRREFGAGPTATLAAQLTRQLQHQGRNPAIFATDQLWAHHALAHLRGIGRERPTGRIPRSPGAFQAIAVRASYVLQQRANFPDAAPVYYAFAYVFGVIDRRRADAAAGWASYVDAAAVRSLTWGE